MSRPPVSIPSLERSIPGRQILSKQVLPPALDRASSSQRVYANQNSPWPKEVNAALCWHQAPGFEDTAHRFSNGLTSLLLSQQSAIGDNRVRQRMDLGDLPFLRLPFSLSLSQMFF
jgi:hypothetical protein